MNAVERANAFFRDNAEKLVPHETCFSCSDSSNCVGAYIGDIFMFVVLPLLIFSPVIVFPLYILASFLQYRLRSSNRTEKSSNVDVDTFCNSLSFWGVLRVSCCCTLESCFRVYLKWKSRRKTKPNGGTDSSGAVTV